MENRIQPGEQSRIGAIVLAAGYSSRMGEFKPLLPVGGMAALERVIAVLKMAGIEDVVVVTGHNRELLSSILHARQVEEVYNSRFAEGMFTSVQAGIQAALSWDGAFLVPVDCSAIDSRVVRLMKKKIEEYALDNGAENGAFFVPCYEGKKGHPLFIPALYFKEILEGDGSKGLKGVTGKYEDRMIRIETGDEGVVLDMDTREGYEEILQYLEEQNEGEPQVTYRGRLFLVRHGQTEQHADKIFLGQTDVPLNEEGREQARSAGEKIAACNPIRPVVYASDLRRAAETAQIAAQVIGRGESGCLPEIREEKRFRELHLGDWDGRFIEEIKQEFPEEYERRGRNLLTWKRGHDGENFYDLHYRVMKALKKILTEYSRGEKDDDIILVAHSGTIKAILCNLKGWDLEDGLTKQKVDKGSVTIIDFKERE